MLKCDSAPTLSYSWNVAGAFVEYIKDAEFDRVASGHYARVRKNFNSNNGKEERTELLLCADEVLQILFL